MIFSTLSFSMLIQTHSVRACVPTRPFESTLFMLTRVTNQTLGGLSG